LNIPLKSKSNFRHLVHSRSFLIAHHYMRHEKHYFGHISLECVYVKFVSASTPCTHAWTPEKNRLIIIILQCNTEHKSIFLHIPGLKITQIKIPRNVVDVFGILTTWRHMKTSSLKRKDQTSFGFVYASILIKYN
jgi:hypothetical protein